MGTVFLLVKFFSEVSHAADFVNGRIWVNPLSYFKALEASADPDRADRHEGTTAWLQPGRDRFVIDGMDITDDLAAPVEIQKDWLNYIHIFCLHAVHSGHLDLGKITNDNIDNMRSEFMIPDGCLDLGEYAVVVKNVPEFIRRMEAAIHAKQFRGRRGLVRYYDPESFHGEFRDVESLFWKQSKYSYQREFRFAINSGSMSGCPLKLDIGDIKDITLVLKSAELNGPKFLGGEITAAK